MNPTELQIALFLARYGWAAFLVGSGYLIGMWRRSRTRRYASALLARCQQRSTERLNEQQKRLLREFFSEGRSTLEELANDTENDFRVK